MRMFEQGVGIRFKRISVPSHKQIKSSVNKIISQVEAIDPKVSSQFTNEANQLLEQSENPVMLVSQLLAQTSGVTHFTSRSILSGSPNYVALLIRSSTPMFANNKIVEDLIREHVPIFGEVAVGMGKT